MVKAGAVEAEALRMEPEAIQKFPLPHPRFLLSKNKFMSLYFPIKLRRNEAENWLKFKNSQLQHINNHVTLKLYHLNFKVYRCCIYHYHLNHVTQKTNDIFVNPSAIKMKIAGKLVDDTGILYKFQNGQNPELDKIPNGQILELDSRMDKIPEWT